MSCVFQVWISQFSCLTLGEDSVWVKMRVYLWEKAELLCSVCLFPTLFSRIRVSSCPQHHRNTREGQSLPCRAFLGTGFLQKHLLLWAFPKRKSLSASVYISSRALLPVQWELLQGRSVKKNITQNVEMLRLVIAGGEGGECGIQGGCVWVCMHAWIRKIRMHKPQNSNKIVLKITKTA